MKKKLLFLFTLAALLGALCFGVGAIKADRPYQESKTIKIIDHVVYKYLSHPFHEPEQYYAVIDYFDTDEAANDPKIAKTIKIVDKIGKIPVTDILVSVYSEGAYDDVDSGHCSSSHTQNIELPQTIKDLHRYAFEGFSSLRSITLPDSIRVLGSGTFENCYQLREINMKNELTEIGHFAFWNCNQLKKFTFGDNLEQIGESAFYGSGLRSISLSASTFLDWDAFSNCENLTKVKFRANSKEQALSLAFGVFYGSALKTVVFSKNIKDVYIGDSVFGNCRNLQTLKNISNLRMIGERAFENCTALRSFTIPKKIQYIHPYAFLSCVNLKTMYLNSKNPNLLSDSLAFYNQKKSEIDYDYLDCNFIDFLRNDCMIYVKNADMLRMVQEDALHSRAQIAA